MNNETYNGWKNYETWNVALYIQNERALYDLARWAKTYDGFVSALYLHGIGEVTPDGVAWDSSRIDVAEIDEMIKEL